MFNKKYLLGSLIFLSLFLVLFHPVWAQSDIDLIVHYVEGTPIEGKIAYDVKIFLSVLDGGGNPIMNLGEQSFTITEDSRKVEVDSLDSASDEPINIILLIDSSGSMGGKGIEAAREAASNFIQGLGNNDTVAILSFNEEVKRVIDFTSDIQAAREQLSLVETEDLAGTCLYDALYEATQIGSTLPSGRRAVIVLTDGVDEIATGEKCSTFTFDDVVDLASSGTTRVPIYTIGLGNKIDEQTLDRIAARTGGRSLYSPKVDQLGTLFQILFSQLKSQHVLSYTSTEAPGAHTITVEVNHQGAKDQDTRGFVLPALPTTVSIISPVERQEVSGVTKIVAAVSGQGEPVKQVVFEVDGIGVGQDDSSPYEFEWDFSQSDKDSQEISVVAKGENNQELATSKVTVLVSTPAIEETTDQPTPGMTTTPEVTEAIETTEEVKASFFKTTTFYILIIAIFLVILIVILFLLWRRRRDDEDEPHDWGTMEPAYQESGESEDVTFDEISIAQGGDVLAVLTVIHSDDEALIGQKLNITKQRVTLGRSAENDIVLPDKPVSRHHATIAKQGTTFVLSEQVTHDKAGKLKRPTYGTFLNENKVKESQVLPLKSGDEIRLGSRAKLRFTQTISTDTDTEVTVDDLELDGLSGKTTEVQR